MKAIIPPPGGHGADPVTELGALFAMLSAQLQFDQGGKFTVDNDFRTLGVLANPFIWNTTQLGTGVLYSQAWSLPLASVNLGFTPDQLVHGLTSGATGVVLDFNITTSVLRVVNVVGAFVPGETIQTLDTFKSGLLQLTTGIAQSGGNFQITLNALDTHTAAELVQSTIKISGGLGSGQVRIISTFDPVSKIAGITKNWEIIPDGSSHYSIAQIKYPDLQPNSGELIYVENRRPIARAEAQLESIRPVCEF